MRSCVILEIYRDNCCQVATLSGFMKFQNNSKNTLLFCTTFSNSNPCKSRQDLNRWVLSFLIEFAKKVHFIRIFFVRYCKRNMLVQNFVHCAFDKNYQLDFFSEQFELRVSLTFQNIFQWTLKLNFVVCYKIFFELFPMSNYFIIQMLQRNIFVPYIYIFFQIKEM